MVTSHLLSPHGAKWILSSTEWLAELQSASSASVGTGRGVNDFREDLKRMMMDVLKGEGKATVSMLEFPWLV